MTRESMLVAMRRRWWVVVALAVLGALLGALPDPGTTVDSTTTSYTAEQKLVVSNSDPTQSAFTDPVTFNQLKLFATSGDVPRLAAEQLGLGSGQSLAAQLTVVANPEELSLTISTNQGDAETAVAIASTVGDELVSFMNARQDSQREDRLTATLERLENLEKRLRSESAKAADDPSDAVLRAQVDALARQYSVTYEQYDILRSDRAQLIIDPLGEAEAVAIESQGLSAPKSRLSRGVLGAIAGLAVGIMATLALARVDRKLRTAAQTEHIFGSKVQLAIPHAESGELNTVVVSSRRHDRLSDSYRRVRSLVSFLESELDLPEDRAPLVAVVSAGPAEGKTSLTANLSAALAEAGNRVVAVNTDFRKPTLSSRLLGVEHPSGNLTIDQVDTMAAADMLTPSTIDGLSVLDLSGVKASPGELARATARLLPEIRTQTGTVVIDTSPVGATAEVLELIPLADIVIVTVRLGHSSIDACRRTADTLRSLGSAEIVLVLVGASDDRSSAYYYYSEYGSGESASASGRRGRRG